MAAAGFNDVFLLYELLSRCLICRSSSWIGLFLVHTRSLPRSDIHVLLNSHSHSDVKCNSLKGNHYDESHFYFPFISNVNMESHVAILVVIQSWYQSRLSGSQPAPPLEVVRFHISDLVLTIALADLKLCL